MSDVEEYNPDADLGYPAWQGFIHWASRRPEILRRFEAEKA